MSGLLVSVRSAAEARAALEGGADLIDVKDPSRGSLGRADDHVIQEVLDAVAGRCPVSAALGELGELDGRLPLVGLAFAKWGLRGAGLARDWQTLLARSWEWLRRHRPECQPVAVAYADWARVAAVAPVHVLDLARKHAVSVLLIDTCVKDGRTLPDLIAGAELEALCRGCREAGVRVALAGSLAEAELVALRPLEPDWFAVRGAVCRGGRDGTVESQRVRDLAAVLREVVSAATRRPN
jgi:uncharacterized protein (UPF0264 family)